MSSASTKYFKWNDFRIIGLYLFAQMVISIGAGFVWGLLRIVLSIPLQSGSQLDADLVGRLIGTIIVGFVVYRDLSRRYSKRYFVLGWPVAILTGALNVALASLGTSARIWLLILSIVFQCVLMLLSWAFFRPLRSAGGVT